MIKRILHLDLETRSDLDLRKVGLAVYARGKNTDIVCAAFAFDDDVPDLWYPGQTVPPKIIDFIEAGGEIWAHNAAFERDMINFVGVRKYGWPYIYTEQMVCTMAMAYAMGLPGTLDGCSSALGIEQRKDLEGSRIMLQLCKPRAIDPVTGKIQWWDDLVKLRRLYEYCAQDVVVERAAGKRMLQLSSYEKRVWVLDQKINDRGIKIDIKAAFAASMLVEEEKTALNIEMQKVSGNEIATCTAVAQIKKFLEKHSIFAESIDKAATTELLLSKDLPAICREVLSLRQQASKASTAKLDPMISGAGADHRIRGSFQYSGANTRRWAGRRVQFHNLKKPSLKPETITSIIEALRSGKLDREAFTMLYGEPMTVISDLIRAMLVAEVGHEYLACDFNAIEARVVAWLAGQYSTIQIFESGEDIYIHAATSIFGKRAENITSTERAVGKVAVLALGFGGGVGAFQAMAKGYGVTMAPAFGSLWRRAPDEIQSRVEKSFEAYCAKQERLNDPAISREEFIASDLTKVFWREANPAIVQYWADLEDAAIAAVQKPNQIFRAGMINYKKSGSFLFCRLPGGGCICYPYPEIRLTKTPWGQKKNSLTYMSEDSQSKKWLRFTTFGGSLCENVTQAVARDLLADSMLRLEDAGYPIVLHVHDENVCEMPKGAGSLDRMRSIMEDSPAWAKGLPIKASGFIANRYRK